MSMQTIADSKIEHWEARALEQLQLPAERTRFREIAAEVHDEARHGRNGGIRSEIAVFMFRAGRHFAELREARSRLVKQSLDERERYADLFVAVLDQAVMLGASPVAVGRTLQQARRFGHPHVNPRLIEKLLALGERWPSQPLTPPPGPEMPEPGRIRPSTRGRRRPAREGRRATHAVTPRR